MKVNEALTLLPGVTGAGQKPRVESPAREGAGSFGETLTQAMKDVNALQQDAGKAVNQMIEGQEVDLHDVMIAVEKAKTSFELLMEIRNKAVSAYQELMRIQV